ncbi:MAG: hypothetical protein AAF639_35180 [Chloroflexota bacterium]
MNPSQTLTLPEVPTQVPLWLKQAAQVRPRLWLRTIESPKPVAVIVEAEEFERSQKQLYEWQITNLREWLDRIERQWNNQLLREECVQVWKEKTWKLWEVAPEPVQEFLASLTMSAQKLDAQRLSKEQVAALRYALDVVSNGSTKEAEIEKAHQYLIGSHLSSMMTFHDDTLVQLYLEEL